MTEPGQPIKEFTLERFLLGELPPEADSLVREKLSHEPAAAAQLAELEASSAAIFTLYPPAAMATKIESRLRSQRRSPRCTTWRCSS